MRQLCTPLEKVRCWEADAISSRKLNILYDILKTCFREVLFETVQSSPLIGTSLGGMQLNEDHGNV